MSVRPVWRKKLNYCNTSNEVDVNSPTPMPKPQSPLKDPSQENPLTTHSNNDSLKSHSLPLYDSCDTNVGQALIPPQSANQTQLTQPPFHHLLINLHVASVLHAQTPPSPQGQTRRDMINFPIWLPFTLKLNIALNVITDNRDQIGKIKGKRYFPGQRKMYSYERAILEHTS
ncbi:hypothetical protein Tco_1135756 [Tanacetum coccineum]